MGVEKTIRFPVENAAAHDSRLAEMEKNSVIIQQAIIRLAENQTELKSSLQEMQRAMRELSEKTDERIAALVRAIAARDANGPRR